jgi:molybdopterin-containing oxidoreductase family membrane subunit
MSAFSERISLSKVGATLLGIVWLAAFAVGVWGVALRWLHGHEFANYGSYVVWGLWVAAYIYFIGLSAGAFLLSALIYVFASKELENIGKLALVVAVVTLVMALVAIWFDLGHMERFYYVFTRPGFGSMMTWMVWLYSAYFVLLLVELYFALRADLARWSVSDGWRRVVANLLLFGRRSLSERALNFDRTALRVLGSIGVPLAIAFHGGVGALFGTVLARPYWHTPLYPILFLTGALVSGGALMTATVAFFWPKSDPKYTAMVQRLSMIVFLILIFDLILEWAEFSIPMWYGVGPEFELLRKVLFGPFWWVFWILHVLLGTLIPIVIFLTQRSKPLWLGVAGGMIAVTFMAVRLNIVVPGLIEPQLRGLEEAYQHERLIFEYVPSFFEWQVVLFIVAFGFGLFYLGRKLLPVISVGEAKESAQ